MYEADQSGIRDAQNNLQKAQDDMKIAALQKQVDLIQKIIDGYDEQKEKIEEQKKAYNDQIKLLEKQQKVLNDQIEALQEQQKAIQKQQKEYQKQQKELQKQQKEYQKQQEELQKRQQAIQKQMDAASKHYQKLIDAQTKMFDDLIAKLEETKSKWEELAEVEAISKAWGLVAEQMAEYGYTVEDVLNDVPGAFDKFKEEYIKAIQAMHSGDEYFLQGVQAIYGTQVPGAVKQTTAAIDETKTATDNLKAASDILSGAAKSAFGIIDTSADTTAGKIMDLGMKTDEAKTSFEGMNEVTLATLSQTLQDILLDLQNINGADFSDLIVKLGLIDQAVDVEKYSAFAEVFKELQQVVLTTLVDELDKMKAATDETTATNMTSIKDSLKEIDIVDINQLVTDFTTLQGMLPQIVEALTGVDGTSGLVNALKEMEEISLEDGLIAQFEALQESVVGVTNALDGSGGESSGGESEGEGSGKKKQSGGGEDKEGGNLASALENVKTVADQTIGVEADEEEDTVIGHFNNLGTAIEKVTKERIGIDGEDTEETFLSAIEDAKEVTDKNIGTAADDEGDTVIGYFNQLGKAVETVTKDKIGVTSGTGDDTANNTLDGSIVGLHNTSDEHIPKVEDAFNKLKDKIQECIDKVQDLIDKINEIPDDFGSFTFSGTANKFTGTAFATGSAQHKQGSANLKGNWGIKRDETSLVGELGQELVVSPDGKYRTVGDDGPELTRLHRGEIVFNHLQTAEILDKKNHIKGPAHVDGTLPNGFFRLDDDSAFNKLKEVIKDTALPTIDGIKGIIQAQTDAIKSEIKNIANNNSTATTVNQSNTFNISGVSGEDVARQINNTLVNTFSGMSIKAYQRSMA